MEIISGVQAKFKSSAIGQPLFKRLIWPESLFIETKPNKAVDRKITAKTMAIYFILKVNITLNQRIIQVTVYEMFPFNR